MGGGKEAVITIQWAPRSALKEVLGPVHTQQIMHLIYLNLSEMPEFFTNSEQHPVPTCPVFMVV